MRARWLVAVLLLVPLVPAQDLPESIEGIDPSGDVELFAPDGTSLGTTDQFPHLDVLGGRVSKAESGDMAFEILLQDPSYAQRGDQEGDLQTSIALHFHFGSIHYYVDYGDWRRNGGDACLTRYIDGERIDHIECFPTAMAGDWIRVEIPGRYITDHVGAVLRHPAQLDDSHAEGRVDVLILDMDGIRYARAIDRAPDDEAWGGILTPPDAGAGPLLVNPLQAVRGSNGGPEVLTFHLLVDNLVDEPVTASVRVADIPDGWDAKAPARVTVQAGTTRDVPVLVEVPGHHAHGSTHAFNVTVALDEGRSWTEQLAVHFFTIAQPAGHHDTLYLHGEDRGDVQRAWMDTLPTHPDEDGTPHRGWGITQRSLSDGQATTLYMVRFTDDLRIGLDFLVDATVDARFSLTSDLATEASVRAGLEHCNPFDPSGRSYAEYGGDMRCAGSWFPLAQSTFETSIAPEGTALEVDLPVTPYADLVAPAPGALLAFFIELERPIQDEYINSVVLETTGSSLRLPLLEYRDPLDDGLAALAGLSIEGPDRLTVGPGSELWIPLSLANDGPTTRSMSFEVFGHNSQWAEARPAAVTLPAGGGGTVHVHARVPDAPDQADLFIVATDTDDPTVTVAHGLRIQAEPSAETRNDAAPDGVETTPALSLLLLGTLLTGLAARRR